MDLNKAQLPKFRGIAACTYTHVHVYVYAIHILKYAGDEAII